MTFEEEWDPYGIHEEDAKIREIYAREYAEEARSCEEDAKRVKP